MRIKLNSRSLASYYPLILALAILICFGVIFWVPFFYDDSKFILENPLITGSWPGFKALFLNSFGGSGEYGPLIPLIHWFVFHVASDQPYLYRAISLALHIANSLLVFRFCRRILGRPSPAFWIAMLFSLYPAQAEVLAVSTFDKHLGVAFFALLILNIQAGRPWGRNALCWICFIFALLCKESALMIPWLALTIAAASSARGKNTIWKDAALHIGLFSIALAYIVCRFFIVPRRFDHLLGGSWVINWLTSGKILLWDLAELAWPSSLCLEHSLAPAGMGLEAVLIMAALICLIYLCLRLYRFDSIAWLGSMWCLLFLMPFLNLVPNQNLSFTLVTNRYLYFASAGFFLMVVRLLGRIFRAPAWDSKRVWGLAALSLAYMVLSIRQAASYVDPLELWSQTIRCAPQNPGVHFIFGHTLLHRKMFPQAERELRRAIELAPNYQAPYDDLAFLYSQTGRLPLAIATAQQRLALNPDSQSFLELGFFEIKAGQDKRACADLQQAIDMDSSMDSAHLSLGLCSMDLGRLGKAEREFQQAQKEPRQKALALCGLGKLYLRQGLIKKSIGYFEGSLAQDPWQIDAIKNLAQIYISSGQRARAQSLYQESLRRLDAFAASAKADNPQEEDAREAVIREFREQLESDRKKRLANAASGQ